MIFVFLYPKFVVRRIIALYIVILFHIPPHGLFCFNHTNWKYRGSSPQTPQSSAFGTLGAYNNTGNTSNGFNYTSGSFSGASSRAQTPLLLMEGGGGGGSSRGSPTHSPSRPSRKTSSFATGNEYAPTAVIGGDRDTVRGSSSRNSGRHRSSNSRNGSPDQNQRIRAVSSSDQEN
jgi:hypothetical protein